MGYSQNNPKLHIYLDENNNQIDQLTYSTRLLKNIYREHTINKDSVTVKKLRKLYEFDSLNAIELKQVQNVFHKYLDINDFNKNIIIIYRDSLLGYDEFFASVDQKRSHDAMDIDSEKKYLKRRKSYDSNQKKCKKFSNKNNTTVIYGYSEKENFTFKPKNYVNQKIPSVLKSIFFQGKKRGTLILKPNGQYFFYSYLSQKQVIRMLNSNWEKYIRDYNTVMNNDNIYTMRFIDEMKAEHKADMRDLAVKQLSRKNSSSNRSSSSMTSSRRIRIQPPYNCFGYASY